MFRSILSVSLMFPFSNKYLVDSGTYLKKNEQETSILVDNKHSNLCSFDKNGFSRQHSVFIRSGSGSFSGASKDNFGKYLFARRFEI